FFYDHTSPTEFYTLSLHDALPIWVEQLEPVVGVSDRLLDFFARELAGLDRVEALDALGGIAVGDRLDLEWVELAEIGDLVKGERDRKSTRLNSSHLVISYAVFCLK